MLIEKTWNNEIRNRHWSVLSFSWIEGYRNQKITAGPGKMNSKPSDSYKSHLVNIMYLSPQLFPLCQIQLMLLKSERQFNFELLADLEWGSPSTANISKLARKIQRNIKDSTQRQPKRYHQTVLSLLIISALKFFLLSSLSSSFPSHFRQRTYRTTNALVLNCHAFWKSLNWFTANVSTYYTSRSRYPTA